jgi:hypothetical protein
VVMKLLFSSAGRGLLPINSIARSTLWRYVRDLLAFKDGRRAMILKPLKHGILLLSPLLFILSACSGGGNGGGDSTPNSPSGSIDTGLRATWEARMLQSGRALCDQGKIQELSTWEGNVWYYDGIRTYYQMAYYTGDTDWEQCAGYVRELYLKYVLDNNGQIPGWRVFPIGLQMDFERRGSQESRQALLALASNSAFARSGGGLDPELSRETAYLIHAYLSQEQVGGGVNQMLESSREFALEHLKAWTVAESTQYVKPFMVGLTFEALIRYYEERDRDPRILSAIQIAADWLWSKGWRSSAQAFEYIVCKDEAMDSYPECRGPDAGPAAELNLLIGPAYGWLYKETKDPLYRERAIAVFSGGVQNATLSNGKQFNQNYRWSFDLLKWLEDQ